MWSLSPEILHLNHGSFGAVPVTVQETQLEWRRRWEAAPTAFILDVFPAEVEAARSAVARFVGADPEGFAFVRNATTAVASVVRSIEPWFGPGDEILTTTHDYNAVRQTLEFTASRTGATVKVVPVPFPIDSPDVVTSMVLGAVGPRTRLVVVDHVTSPTALIYPVAQIVSALEPEIPVLVDGAHAPGQVPLELDRLGASWYTGNLHKWVCAPKGAAFLSTRRDRVDETFPVVISHGWNTPLVEGSSRYHSLFDWIGTDDITPWLTAPSAIEVVGGSVPGGWPEVMGRNHTLAVTARRMLCETLGVSPPAPEEMIGSMAAVVLGDRSGPRPDGLLSPLDAELLARGIETLVMIWPEWPHQVLRISAHLYNELEDYERLAELLSERVG